MVFLIFEMALFAAKEPSTNRYINSSTLNPQPTQSQKKSSSSSSSSSKALPVERALHLPDDPMYDAERGSWSRIINYINKS